MALPLDRARAFLAAKRIAVVGVSRNEKDFSRAVFRELLRRGHDVVPVNPALTEVEGRRAWAAVSQIAPPVEAVLVLTPPSATVAVVRDAIRASVRKVWLHRGAGAGSGTPEALAVCEADGVEAVHDLCPFMAFPDAGLLHRAHGFFRRRFGHPMHAALHA